jgi:uncharacterized heparinase superfamily protein
MFYNPRKPSMHGLLHKRAMLQSWQRPAARSVSLLGSNRFRFLNLEHILSNQDGWVDESKQKLWLYNLHYFDDLNAQNASVRFHLHRPLIERWVRENPPTYGIGWEPYPTSLRIVNWIKWQLSGNTITDQCLQSLVIQVRWLAKRVEWHILGNHLFANAKALVFAGLFFEGPEASAWLNKGLKIIYRELLEQVLVDGGNFERSPMYHSIFLEDLLDLINLAGTYPEMVEREQVDQWRAIAIKMLKWHKAMCHPDGEIAFFNDAAIGIAPSPAEINAYACRLGIFASQLDKPSVSPVATQFLDSGYIRLATLNAVALLDVAQIGPDYLPGHAHADTLSFELSLFAERVLVNSGTSEYGSGPIRLDERGTKAHNTVTINGKNSSEVWSGFRVARRAYPIDLVLNQSKELVTVSCAHDGYRRLPGQVIHKRVWQFRPGKLLVQDLILGEFETAAAHFHFHPDIKITALDHCTYTLYLPGSGQKIQFSVLSGSARIEQSFFAPEFGIRLTNQCLSVEFESDNTISVEISWSIDE